MVKQVINVGTSVNDGMGDTLRIGAQKINENFNELYNSAAYTLPAASTSIRGGVIVDGVTLAMQNGVLSVNSDNIYSLPTASTVILGGVRVDGTTVTVGENGVISASSSTFTGGTIIGITNISNTTQSTSALTGALTVAGGVGISKNINLNGSLNFSTDSRLYTSGTIQTSLEGLFIVGGNLDSAETAPVGLRLGTIGGTQASSTGVTVWGDTGQEYANQPNYSVSIVADHVDDTDSFVAQLVVGETYKQTVGTYNAVTRTSFYNGLHVIGDLITGSGNIVFNSSTLGIVFGDGTKQSTAATSYSLPTATTNTLGGVKVDGTSISISNGVISSSGLTSRITVSGTISLASTASGNLSLVGFKGYALLGIQVTAGAWVSVYTSTASRTADASRLRSSDPVPGAGVLAEIITTGASTQYFTPAVVGFSTESPPSTSIPIKVYNNSGAQSSITVTLTLIKLES